MHESTEHDADREQAKQGDAGTGHRARINQQRHEPVPASHGADNDQSAAGHFQWRRVRGMRCEAPHKPTATPPIII